LFPRELLAGVGQDTLIEKVVRSFFFLYENAKVLVSFFFFERLPILSLFLSVPRARTGWFIGEGGTEIFSCLGRLMDERPRFVQKKGVSVLIDERKRS
jgi:hypothetical protein